MAELLHARRTLLVIIYQLVVLSGCGTKLLPSSQFPSSLPGMRFIAGETFRMGETGIAEPVHQVTVSSFYIDTALVTQEQYRQLMNVAPSYFTGEPSLPADNMTWFDAVLFCNDRSRACGLDTVYSFLSIFGPPGNGCDSLENLQIHLDRKGFRLPTEAEYECAYRAGTSTEYYWGDTVDGRYCWYWANSDSTMHPVAQKLPNGFGLFDMAGELWEWCNDWYGPYQAGSQTDPAGPASGEYRVVRGGCWYIYYEPILGAAFRSYFAPAPPRFQPPKDYYGFRCVVPCGG
jgi:formylglycine-generating enzyme required for sulfatase activity